MTERQKAGLHTALALLLPLVVPAWMLLRGKPAGLVAVIVWPFLFVIANLQVVWWRLRCRECRTEEHRKLSRKVYNFEGVACLFLGLYEAGSSLALSGAEHQRLEGVLAFTVYFYLPYALLTIWAMKCLHRLLAAAAQPADREVSSESASSTPSRELLP
jgi:hypothetical protein